MYSNEIKVILYAMGLYLSVAVFGLVVLMACGCSKSKVDITVPAPTPSVTPVLPQTETVMICGHGAAVCSDGNLFIYDDGEFASLEIGHTYKIDDCHFLVEKDCKVKILGGSDE